MDSDPSSTQPSERVLLGRQVLLDRIAQIDRQHIHDEIPQVQMLTIRS